MATPCRTSGGYEESLAAYDKAVALAPKSADGWAGRARALVNLKRHGDAVESFARLLHIAPAYELAKGSLAEEKLKVCDWDGLDALKQSIDADVRAGKKTVTPFGYLALSHDPADLKRCAEILVASEFPAARDPLCGDAHYRHDKIRLGYLCGEFREHPVAMLTVEVFEAHDKSEFELFAFDTGYDDGSALRKRLDTAFDHMVDLNGLGDAEAAAAIRQYEIDILIDLNGYSGAAASRHFQSPSGAASGGVFGVPRHFGRGLHRLHCGGRVRHPAGT